MGAILYLWKRKPTRDDTDSEENFNFDAVYHRYSLEESPTRVSLTDVGLKVDGLKPTDVKPSTPVSRESVFIFNRAVSSAPSFTSLQRQSESMTHYNVVNHTSKSSKFSNPSLGRMDLTNLPRQSVSESIKSRTNQQDSDTSTKSKELSTRDKKSPPQNVVSSKALNMLSTVEVSTWLESINMGKYASMFAANDMTGSVLSEIESVSDLIDCGVTMPPPVARAFLRELFTLKTKGVIGLSGLIHV